MPLVSTTTTDNKPTEITTTTTSISRIVNPDFLGIRHLLIENPIDLDRYKILK